MKTYSVAVMGNLTIEAETEEQARELAFAYPLEVIQALEIVEIQKIADESLPN